MVSERASPGRRYDGTPPEQARHRDRNGGALGTAETAAPPARPAVPPPSAVASPRAPPRGRGSAGSWSCAARASSCPPRASRPSARCGLRPRPPRGRGAPVSALERRRSRPQPMPLTSSTPSSIVGGCHVPLRTPPPRPASPPARPASRSTCVASSAFTAGTITPSSPARAAAIATDRTPGRRHQLALQRELTGQRVSRERRGGDLSGGCQDARRHGEVEPRTLLAEGAGREIHDHPSQWPLEPLALNGRTDAVARVAHGGPRQPREREGREASSRRGPRRSRGVPRPRAPSPRAPVRTCDRTLGRVASRVGDVRHVRSTAPESLLASPSCPSASNGARSPS